MPGISLVFLACITENIKQWKTEFSVKTITSITVFEHFQFESTRCLLKQLGQISS